MSTYYKKKTVAAVRNYFSQNGYENIAAELNKSNRNYDNIILTQMISKYPHKLRSEHWDHLFEIIRKSEDSM